MNKRNAEEKNTSLKLAISRISQESLHTKTNQFSAAPLLSPFFIQMNPVGGNEFQKTHDSSNMRSGNRFLSNFNVTCPGGHNFHFQNLFYELVNGHEEL